MDLDPLLAHVVVYKTNWVIVQLGMVLQLTHDLTSGPTRPYNQNVLACSIMLDALSVHAHREAGPSNDQHCKQQINRNYRTRVIRELKYEFHERKHKT